MLTPNFAFAFAFVVPRNREDPKAFHTYCTLQNLSCNVMDNVPLESGLLNSDAFLQQETVSFGSCFNKKMNHHAL